MNHLLWSQTVEFLTPGFGRGAYDYVPEIREPAIRGLVRWWVRALGGKFFDQKRIFGAVQGGATASRLVFRVSSVSGSFTKADALPHKLSRRQRAPADVFAAGSCFHLDVLARRGVLSANDQITVKNALDAWVLLGMIGRRGNRAAGSLWKPGWTPTAEEFQDELKRLAIPGDLIVRILNPAVADPENLRLDASDTVNGVGPGTFPNDPIGYARDRDRKASPLKLKVGRFVDGFRLIAVQDDRDHRGAGLPAVIAAMSASGKPLAGGLTAAGPWR